MTQAAPHVFDHEPPGVEPHDLVLTTSWADDEPEHLVCETCDLMWTVGPRVQRIDTGQP